MATIPEIDLELKRVNFFMIFCFKLNEKGILRPHKHHTK